MSLVGLWSSSGSVVISWLVAPFTLWVRVNDDWKRNHDLFWDSSPENEAKMHNLAYKFTKAFAKVQNFSRKTHFSSTPASKTRNVVL